MSVMAQQPAGGGKPSGLLYNVIELILDRGLVIDVFVRVAVLGIEVLTIDARVVVASVDTYLRFAEACNRLNLGDSSSSTTLPELLGDVTGSDPAPVREIAPVTEPAPIPAIAPVSEKEGRA